MKKIMILGAGLLQSYVIKRANDLGYYTVAVDMDKTAVGFHFADEYKLISITEEKECFDYAVKSKIDGILTAATDYGVLTSSYISEHLKLNGIEYNVAKTIKNKYSVRQKLFENNLNLDEGMQFFEVSSFEDVKSISDEVIFPAMVKPCDGSGSKGVSKVENKKELFISSTIAMNNSLTHKALIESFVEGKEYGAESFVLEGKVYILGIMEKIMTKPPCYAELGHMIPNKLNSETEKEVQKTIVNAIHALGINYGSVNMDFLITSDNKICIVDIGARMGGNLIGSHIIPFSTGIDYVGNMIKAAVGDITDFTPKQNLSIASSILSLTPGKVKKLPKQEEIISEKGIMELVLNLKTGDTIRPYCNNLDGCGYVVAVGDTSQEAMASAMKAKQKLDMLIERENYV